MNIGGSDSPEIRGQRITRKFAETQFTLIDNNLNNTPYLLQHESDIVSALRYGLNTQDLYKRSIELLFNLLPTFYFRDSNETWKKLTTNALDYATDLKDPAVLEQIYAAIGNSNLIKNDVNAARRWFYNALEYAYATSNQAHILVVCIGLLKAETYKPSEDFGNELIVKALALESYIQSPQLTATLYGTLATVYGHRGDTRDALGYGMTSLGYAYQQNQPGDIAKNALALSIAYTHAEKPNLKAAQKAVALANRYKSALKEPQYRVIIQYQVASIAYLQGDYNFAITALDEAIDGFQHEKLHLHLANAYHLRGLLHTNLEEYAQAEHDIHMASTIWQSQAHPYNEASMLYALAELKTKQGQITEAKKLLQQAYEKICEAPPSAMVDALKNNILSRIPLL